MDMATRPPVESAIHRAYLVGGSPDVARDMERHLLGVGVEVAGHCKIDGRGRDVLIPKRATVVLCATDASLHAAVDAARMVAKKRGLPCVLAPFRHWSLCRERLTEAGIVASGVSSVFRPASGLRSLTESTETVGVAIVKRGILHPTTPETHAMRADFEEWAKKNRPDLVEAVHELDALRAPKPEPAPASALPPAPEPQPEPELPHQDITPSFRGKDIMRPRLRTMSAAARARHDLARKLIRDAQGQITNTAVRKAVKGTGSVTIGFDAVNKLRVELGYKPHGNGGREREALTARQRGVPQPKKEPRSEATKAAPPPGPEAGKQAPRGRRKRDAFALIAELQEEMRARGIWGVMIEASGTFTFQQGK